MREYAAWLKTDCANGPTFILCGKITARNASHAFDLAMREAEQRGVYDRVEKAHVKEMK